MKRYTAVLVGTLLLGSLLTCLASERKDHTGLGLKWLAAQQADDGGWRYAEDAPKSSPTEATGWALLTFLNVRYTHQDGAYKTQIARGLRFLIQAGENNRGQQQEASPFDLRGQGGDLVSHAIATLALCEACAMTQEKTLQAAAQAAVDFIVDAQHEQGGWGSKPESPRDLIVTAWVLQALKSGHLAYLKVPKQTIADALKFLRRVQAERDANKRQLTATETAAYCWARLVLGSKPQDAEVKQGVAVLLKQGPSDTDLAYNRVATEVVCLFSFDEADDWLRKLRPRARQSQITAGPQAGSWKGQRVAGDRLTQTVHQLWIVQIRLSDYHRNRQQEDDF